MSQSWIKKRRPYVLHPTPDMPLKLKTERWACPECGQETEAVSDKRLPGGMGKAFHKGDCPLHPDNQKKRKGASDA